MRVDRRCWARSVYQDKQNALWGFKGIARPSGTTILGFHVKKSAHAQLVLCDERYIDALHYTEAKYIASDDGWLDDWREFVEAHLHGATCCPHENPERYKARVDWMLNDADARFTWARDRVDHGWICDSVESQFESEESIFYFLKDHPVDSVWAKEPRCWINLDAVLGFCPSCDEALLEKHLCSDEGGPPHPFNKDCSAAHCESGASLCLYNKEGKIRDLFECLSCAWTDVTQDVGEEDETFVSKYGRPFDWPPGAPYPPRRSFSGFPMDVPPYED